MTLSEFSKFSESWQNPRAVWLPSLTIDTFFDVVVKKNSPNLSVGIRYLHKGSNEIH